MLKTITDGQFDHSITWESSLIPKGRRSGTWFSKSIKPTANRCPTTSSFSSPC
jgi:hypothetical protein